MKDRKEEILRKYADGWVGGMTSGDKDRIVYPAMEQYAQEIAVGFDKWKLKKGYTAGVSSWLNFSGEIVKDSSPEFLYEKYLKSIQQTSK